MGRVGERRESGRSEPKAGAAVEIRRAKERVSEFRAPQTAESFCPCHIGTQVLIRYLRSFLFLKNRLTQGFSAFLQMRVISLYQN